jgi:hypothetical protein
MIAGYQRSPTALHVREVDVLPPDPLNSQLSNGNSGGIKGFFVLR